MGMLCSAAWPRLGEWEKVLKQRVVLSGDALGLDFGVLVFSNPNDSLIVINQPHGLL